MISHLQDPVLTAADSKIRGLLSKHIEMISGLAPTLFTVLNGFRGTEADARHAVGAVVAPDRLAVLNRDVVRRAEPCTLTAASAGIAGRKGICFDEESIEDWIHRATHEAVVEIIAGRRERLIGRDGGDHTVNVRLGLDNDLPCFLRLRCVEHGNVVFGHDDLRRAHIGELFLLAEYAIIFGGVANLTATGHDEPSLLCAGEVRFSQPIPHNVRNAPCVSGRDNNKTLIGCDWRSIARLDAVIHAKKLVA